MTEIELLSWLRGPCFQISVAIFVFGLVYRISQNLALGRKKNLAAPRGNGFSAGLNTIWRRSFFQGGISYRGYFTLIAGYAFHLGFLVTLFFMSQHIIVFRSIFGFGWPALPPAIIDITALIGIAALIAVLIHRIQDPVLRKLSDYQDYLAWALTFLPLASGFILVHPMDISYTLLLCLHIISAEVLLIVIPFTKLSHMISIFIARWYNGAIAGYKGVQS
jgi:nitrate reductase gamma subunit